MVPRIVPPEVARRIVLRAPDRETLLTLTRTSRNLQSAAEKLLYETVELIPYPSSVLLLETLAECPRVAAYVRRYVFTTNPPYRVPAGHEREVHRTIQSMVLRHEFWENVSASLAHLTQLDVFVLVDPTLSQSWILDRALTLRATEARLGMAWDERVASFLERQDQLRLLTVTEVAENVPLTPLSPNSLPNLVQFEGPLLVADLFLDCPISHLKFPIDTEDAISLLPLVLPQLHRLKKLRSLSFTSLPPEMLLPSMSTISTTCPNLQYLSHIPLPMDHTSHLTLLTYLSHLTHLKVLEVEVHHWLPPLAPPFQRAVAASLHVVLPNLRYVFFWGRHERTLWMWNPDDLEPIQVHPQPTFPIEPLPGETGELGAGYGTGGAGAAPVVPPMASLEEPTTYVGLEGWQHSWNSGQIYANSSSAWKSAV